MGFLKRYESYENLILRLFLGIPLLLWAIQKLTMPSMADVYVKDFQQLIFINPYTFLIVAGVIQVILAAMLIFGIYTRIPAAALIFIGLITFIVPGFITIGNIYKFAYGIVIAGGGLSLLIRGGGAYSWDAKQLRRQRHRAKTSGLLND